MIPLVATGLGLPWDRLPAPLGCASAAGRAGAHGGCRAGRAASPRAARRLFGDRGLQVGQGGAG